MTNAPTHGSPSFDCPHCGAHAQQTWPEAVFYRRAGYGDERWISVDRSECFTCGNEAIWHRRKVAERGALVPGGVSYRVDWQIVWPRAQHGEPPHARMPQELLGLYDEAREVAGASPRASAALLRLLTETLLRDIAESPNGNLNDLIGQLVQEQKLDEQTRKIADYLRITGNNAVHPGQIVADDDAQRRASMMFPFVNALVQRLIADPAEIAEIYALLPEGKRQAADRRDGRSPSV